MPESNLWTTRISNANKHFDEWESKFKCKRLVEYWENFQWKGKRDFNTLNYQPYTINLFYSTIKIKLASLLFQRPQFIVAPRPGNSDWNLELAIQSATLKQDVLNTIISNPNCHFVDQVKLATLDSFFYFSIIEVGYAADWRNPGKAAPLTKSHFSEEITEQKDKVIEDEEVPINERFYFKRINPKRFRVSVSDATELNDHEWVGYYDYYYTSTLKNTKGIKWPDDATEIGEAYSADYQREAAIGSLDSKESAQVQALVAEGKVSKVWHIWDLVAKERLLILDSNKAILWRDNFERLPLIDHKWDFRTEGWYPVPPSFHWISPQDEINEAREQTRSYRRRFTRKFQAQKGMISEEEKEKFASGPDGVIVETEQKDAISPIQNPEIGPTAQNALVLAKDDFNIISGTSAELMQPDRETATAAKIKSTKAGVRESAEQLDFSNWLCNLGREVLAQAGERLTTGLWVKYTADPGEGVLTDMNPAGMQAFKYITGQDLSDGYDFDIEIDITNATPAAMQQAQQAFIQFLSLVQNFPMLAMSPVLIREAAYRCGYRNERVIQQIQQTAVLSMAAKAAQAGAAAPQAAQGMNANNIAGEQVAQMNPGTEQEVQNQLDQQLLQ